MRERTVIFLLESVCSTNALVVHILLGTGNPQNKELSKDKAICSNPLNKCRSSFHVQSPCPMPAANLCYYNPRCSMIIIPGKAPPNNSRNIFDLIIRLTIYSSFGELNQRQIRIGNEESQLATHQECMQQQARQGLLFC